MFKRSKSKVLVESASEGEEDEEQQRHPGRAHRAKEPDQEEDVASPASEEVKVKVKSKKEKKDKKLFPQLFAQDDQHFLLTGLGSQNRGTSSRKSKEEEKGKTYLEKGFWDSVTMTMKQITPTKRTDKMEGWEPPNIGKMTEVVEEHVVRDSFLSPDEHPSWTGLEEDSSTYTSLSDPPSSGVRWTTKAKGKLAGIRRRSRGSLNENWEGLK